MKLILGGYPSFSLFFRFQQDFCHISCLNRHNFFLKMVKNKKQCKTRVNYHLNTTILISLALFLPKYKSLLIKMSLKMPFLSKISSNFKMMWKLYRLTWHFQILYEQIVGYVLWDSTNPDH